MQCASILRAVIPVTHLSNLPVVRSHVNHSTHGVRISANQIDLQPVGPNAALVRQDMVHGSIEVVTVAHNCVHPAVTVDVGGDDCTWGLGNRGGQSVRATVGEVAPAIVEQQDVSVLSLLGLGAAGENVEVAVVVEVRSSARTAVVQQHPARNRHGACVTRRSHFVRRHRPISCTR